MFCIIFYDLENGALISTYKFYVLQKSSWLHKQSPKDEPFIQKRKFPWEVNFRMTKSFWKFLW
jgi:hypothetical protein